ncbi:MAG: hypothetical protein ACPF8V_01730 [Luteibaculum sp.]
MKGYILYTLFCLPLLALQCTVCKAPIPSEPPISKDTISPELQAAIDQLPAATDTGANILGFITKENTPYAVFPFGEHEDTYFISSFDGYLLDIDTRKHDDNGVIFYVGMSIVLTTGTPQDTTTVYPLLELGTYPIQEVLYTYTIDYDREGSSICSYLTGAPFQSSNVENAAGDVVLTRIDTAKGIYSGTFNFSIAIDSAFYSERYDSYCPNPLNAFYGRFDVKAPRVEPGSQ